MRSQRLEAALSELALAAGAYLREELDKGAEVSFELGARGASRGGPTLYCYRALTADFIAERRQALEVLAEYAEAARLLERFEGLDRYLASMVREAPPRARRARARVVLMAWLEDVFDEQADFDLSPERLQAALARLESSATAAGAEVRLLGTLHGVAIASEEVQLRTGLALARPDSLRGLPPDLPGADSPGDPPPLLVIHTAGEEDAQEGLAQGAAAMSALLRALRLFGDGRVTLGALGWWRVAAGPWQPVALGAGGSARGILVLGAEQEDELRAFCNLVERRAGQHETVAWALRRFELGCECESPLEGLTDHLLALRALLEPEGPQSGLLAARVAALCADREHRGELERRVLEALDLEREMIVGAVSGAKRARALAEEISTHLRALLSDVIAGHLDSDLAALADTLSAAAPEHAGQLELEAALPEAADAGPEAASAETANEYPSSAPVGEPAAQELADLAAR